MPAITFFHYLIVVGGIKKASKKQYIANYKDYRKRYKESKAEKFDECHLFHYNGVDDPLQEILKKERSTK